MALTKVDSKAVRKDETKGMMWAEMKVMMWAALWDWWVDSSVALLDFQTERQSADR
jgi:hypothetical protein